MLDSLETTSALSSSAITYSCCQASELTPAEWLAWSAIQQTNQPFDSPFFRPEFTRLVEATRGGVEVAVVKRGNEPVGFFPFHRDQESHGRPVGEPLNDFQGPVLQEGIEFSPYALLECCQLNRWTYDHLPGQLATPETGKCRCAESPLMDLSNGFEAYQDRIVEQGSSILKKSRQYSRKVERDIGPIRWVWQDDPAAAFDQLAQWKTLIYEQLGAVNIFQVDWIRSLLQKVTAYDTPEFSGLLTSLYAGDELLAVHLGMQSGPVLHWWLPSYNPKFAKYSVGTILLTEAAVRSHERNIQRIDLGKGPESYKQRYATGSTSLCEGVIDANVISRTLRSGWYLTRNTLVKNRWGAGPLRCYRTIRDWWSQHSSS